MLKPTKPFIFFLIFALSPMAWGASGITYHGRIVKPDNTPLESANARFRIQIKSPNAENCLLWEEEQTKNLLGSNGVFSITIGDSTDITTSYTRVDTYGWGMERVFSNRTQFTALTGCSVGTTYTPGAADGRILEVSFKEQVSDPTWEAFPATKINLIPMAMNSLQLEGYRADEFLKIDPYVNQTPLTNAGVNTLLGLIAGTSTVYVKPADPLGGDLTGTIGAGTVVGLRGRALGAAVPAVGQVLKFDGTSWVPSADDTGGAPADASYAAKGIVQFQTSEAVSGLSVVAGVAKMTDVGTPGTYGSASNIPVITTDIKGRVTNVVNTAVNDATKLPLAGGTMTGPINMGLQNITNATSVAATNFSGRNLLLSDNDTNVATIRAPVNIVADYFLTLPTTAPVNGYVLSTDAGGQLSWIPAATGSVTSVGATAPVLTTGGTTPVISLDTGLGANKVPQVGGTALGANGVIVANGTATALTSLNCAVNQVIKFDASGFATCGTDDAGAANAFLQNGNAFGAAAVLGTNDNNSLGFETNGTTKMTLLPSGFLGVNTTTPQSFLDIAVPVADTTSSARITLSTHDQTYAQPELLLVHTRPNFNSGWGDAGVGGWKVASVSGSGGSGGMAADFTLCSKNGANSEACRIHIDWASGNMNLGGPNASVHFGSKVNVAGNMTVGLNWSSYNTEQAAPANSLIVEGSVGIGTATPATRLDVSGAVRIGNDATACAAGLAGSLRYNAGVVEYCNGTSWQAFGVSGAGLTSLNGQTGNTQTFNVTATGLTPAINSAANVHTLSIPLASGAGVTSGTISKTDFDNFSGKLTSPLTTKGDILVQNATVPDRLAVGTNGQILSANSATSTGLEWIAAPAGDITSVVAGAGLITGGTTGDVTVDVAAGNGIVVAADSVAVDTGLGINKIPQVGGTALGANGVVVANGTATALTSLNCAVNQVIKFDASGFATCGADDTGATNAFVQNGNAFGGPATIGTNDNFALNIETNNTTRMTFLNNGNVGIGTNAPNRQLTAVGRTGVGPDAAAYDSGSTLGVVGFGTGASSPWISIDSASSMLNFSSDNATDGSSIGYQMGSLTFKSQTALSYGNPSVVGTPRMTLTDAGNVGVGISNPAYKLDVVGDVNVTGNFRVNGTIFTGGAATSVSAINGSAATPSIGFSSDAGTGLFTDAGDNGYTNVASNGNQVAQFNNGAFESYRPVRVTNGNSAATAAFSFGGDPNTGMFNPAAETVAFTTNGAERVRITSTGSVGIGTTSPVGRFDLIDTKIVPTLDQVGLRTIVSSGFLSGATSIETVGASLNAVASDSSGTHSGAVKGSHSIATVDGTTYTRSSVIGADGLGSALAITSGTVANLIGLRGGAVVNNNATATNAISVLANSITEGGTGIVTNAYGLYLEPQTVGTNNWQIYSAGTANSYFAGNVGIGTTSPQATLDVNGTIRGKASVDNPTAIIDFANGNLHHTTNDCGSFALHNMKDGATYMFIVKGTNSATCAFTGFSDAGSTALTVKLPPGHSSTTTGKHTIYNFIVSGTDVYVSWIPGY